MGTVTWDDADLLARLFRALDIARRAVAHFASEGYIDGEVPENSFRPDKPIAECAMLLYAASAATDRPEVARRVDEIARFLIPHARSNRTALTITLHPSLSMDYAVPHVLLSRLGYPDARFDAVLDVALTSQARAGHERLPFAAVEQRWLTSVWTGSTPGREWLGDLRNSVLNHPVDLLGGIREDAYAFTHLVMYCTDFGSRSARLPRPRSVILGEACSLLARCLDEENYDLAAEVLMTWPLLGARWSATPTFGFRVLARVEDRVGVLPVALTKRERLDRLEGEERTRYALGTAYHTALVMGLLCAACLHPGRAPSMRIPGRRSDAAFVDMLLQVLEQDRGHWFPVLSEVTDAERRSLAPLLLDLAILQRCRKRDYSAVGKLLRAAHPYGLASSPLAGQAAQLLERLAVCADTLHPGPGAPARVIDTPSAVPPARAGVIS